MNNEANRKPLDGVVCSVDNCVFHSKGNRCVAGSIAVRMEKENPKAIPKPCAKPYKQFSIRLNLESIAGAAHLYNHIRDGQIYARTPSRMQASRPL